MKSKPIVMDHFSTVQQEIFVIALYKEEWISVEEAESWVFDN